VNLASLRPEIREAIEQATAADLHAAVVSAGAFTILDFFDSIPWLRGGSDWTPWRAFVAALYGLPMTAEELEIYRACTGRKKPPEQKATEAWVPTGRRGRKSACVAVIGSYEAAFRDHSKYLAPGERARIPIISKDKDDAQTIKRYVEEIFKGSSLSFLLQGEPTAEEIKLTNRVDFRIRAASITAGRSKSIPFAALDELAFFRSEDSANPDVEIDRGIQGGMANVPGALRIGLSSPYAKRGLLFEKFREHFGREGSPVLVWKAPTLVMHPGNPVIAVHVEKAYADDKVSAAAEYGAEFRDDVETFVPEHVVDAVIQKGLTVRAPVPGVQYVAFVDPSGGTSDSMPLAIGHWEPEKRKAVLDLLDESQAPFDPKDVVERHAGILAQYGIRDVQGDKYAGNWPRSKYNEHGIMYHAAPKPRTQIYLDFLPLMTASTVELLDIPRMRTQLVSLDRMTGRGRDVIDHQPGAHDDVANVTAGCLVRVDQMRLPPRTPAQPPPTTTQEILKQQMRESLASKDKAKAKAKFNPWNRG
jgi:hypothetical protein